MSEWLVDYNHPTDMSREYYFGWRPSYRVLSGIDKPIAAEIGVWEGFNANFALKYIDFGKYYLVDPYKQYDKDDISGILDKYTQEEWDNFYNRARDKFKNYKSVEFIRKTSEEASKEFKDEYFDFVYIDANHEYENVYNDICLWFPKVKKYGVIAGHDLDFDGVKNAVYRFYLETYRDEVEKDFIDETFDVGYNDWWIRKV